MPQGVSYSYPTRLDSSNEFTIPFTFEETDSYLLYYMQAKQVNSAQFLFTVKAKVDTLTMVNAFLLHVDLAPEDKSNSTAFVFDYT